jgi:hypothetical protein
MFDDVLDALEPTPPGVAHAFGGRRVRLNRTVRGDWSASSSEMPESEIDVAELSPFEDEELAPRRQERLLDEAGAARRLLELGQNRGLFALESSALDEELGGRGVCDPRCHPLWPLEASPPEADDELSLWQRRLGRWFEFGTLYTMLAGMLNEGTTRRDSRGSAEAAQGMGGEVAASPAADEATTPVLVRLTTSLTTRRS